MLFNGPQAVFLHALARYRTLTADSRTAPLLNIHRSHGVRIQHVSELLTRSATEIGVAATALGWTRARTVIALDRLGSKLCPVGQRVAWLVPARIGEWGPKARQRPVNAGLLHLDMTSPASSLLPVILTDEARYALALEVD